MGGGQHLLGVTVLALIVQGIVIAGNSDQGFHIQVKHTRNGVVLSCPMGKHGKVVVWAKDGHNISHSDKTEHSIGSAADDPRGLYQCYNETAMVSLQLYFHMCQYCVQLNSAVVIGMVAAEVIATAFLVVAVWCLAAQEPGWLSRASDKQVLLAHDQLYQPLGERNNGQYSHIGVAKARRR